MNVVTGVVAGVLGSWVYIKVVDKLERMAWERAGLPLLGERLMDPTTAKLAARAYVAESDRAAAREAGRPY